MLLFVAISVFILSPDAFYGFKIFDEL